MLSLLDSHLDIYFETIIIRLTIVILTERMTEMLEESHCNEMSLSFPISSYMNAIYLETGDHLGYKC